MTSTKKIISSPERHLEHSQEICTAVVIFEKQHKCLRVFLKIHLIVAVFQGKLLETKSSNSLQYSCRGIFNNSSPDDVKDVLNNLNKSLCWSSRESNCSKKSTVSLKTNSFIDLFSGKFPKFTEEIYFGRLVDGCFKAR